MLPVQTMLFVFFVALTACFNFAEMALVAARPARLDALPDRHRSNAKLVASLKQEPGAFLSAVQCGITATSILAGTFCVNAFITSITSALSTIPHVAPYASPAGAVIAVIAATYLTLVSGELAPKRVALSAPERCAVMIATPLSWTMNIARPFILLPGRSNDLLLKTFHIQEQTNDSTTSEEIRSVILSALQSGTIQATEHRMLESILQLRVRTARTIMTPRRMLEWVDSAMSDEEIRKRIAESPCSKLIVTQGRDGRINQTTTIVPLAFQHCLKCQCQTLAPRALAVFRQQHKPAARKPEHGDMAQPGKRPVAETGLFY